MTAKQAQSLVEAQGFLCALTGWPLTPESATTDHITPISRGGPHILANAQVVIDYVNRAKGQMTNDEFIAMCVAVAKKHSHIGSDDDTQLDQ